MASAVMNMTSGAWDWVSGGLNVPFARAVVFGVHIDGHFVIEVLLVVVILFQLSRKSYKPPKKPLTEKEVDELCDEWVPESLHPPITKEMEEKIQSPILESDEGVHWGVQTGLQLSRSTVVYFKHNDMDSLESTLEKFTRGNRRAEKIRRYIVVEALYQNSGQIAPLDAIVKLKEKYRFRVMLEESHSFGVLGASGRGLSEHYGVPIEKIDIITAGMGHALATDGGFCTGSVRVVDHQRLSSSGYVFSASLPPYLASAAITALDHLEGNPDVITKLRSNITLLWNGLSDIVGLSISSNILSPIVYLKLKKSTGSFEGDMKLLDDIAQHALKEDSLLICTSKKSTLDKCRLPAGIRLFVSAGHSKSDIQKAAESLKRIAALVLSDLN
ncbi:Long chain base biosynthesis protein 1b [Acorus calamus]|uniref:serine C-palmitoyltransferase n=1 Tax=Acorus calamus TaxID=4465 RepID=A0AAV9FKK3_ACOCL|nr:Long chain base biosynthesis protein 1b [Acorus calamus]